MAGRIDVEFCGWRLNVGVGGRYPLAAESSAVLSPLRDGTQAVHQPTSLGVVVYDNFTTLLVGTSSGHLLKVCMLMLCYNSLPQSIQHSLPTALASQVMQSPPSVCPSVCFHSVIGTD